jgi:hypothetical protein
MSIKERIVEMLGGKIADKVTAKVEELPPQAFFVAFALFLLALAWMMRPEKPKVELLKCELCDEEFHPSELVAYEGQLICTECRDTMTESENPPQFPQTFEPKIPDEKKPDDVNPMIKPTS